MKSRIIERKAVDDTKMQFSPMGGLATGKKPVQHQQDSDANDKKKPSSTKVKKIPSKVKVNTHAKRAAELIAKK